MSRDPTLSRTRVKFCGITRPRDALTAASLGADAIGLVFYAKSPRVVELGAAREITQAIPPFITVVGLFVGPEPHQVDRVLDAVPIDLLQFHGDEEPEECARYGHPYIKAIAMRDGLNLPAHARRFASARGFLLDTHHAELYGGTGLAFDWARVPSDGLGKPLILAGGLTPANVAEAITRVRPFAVDVSGGVEAAKGVKDADKMTAFIEGVKSVDDS